MTCGNYTLDQTAAKLSQSAVSDDDTVSDTSTPKASPEPPELMISTPSEEEPIDTATPPPPPPRTFTLPRGAMEQVAKLVFDKGDSKPFPDADKYSKSHKVSDPEEPEGGCLTLKRRENNINMITTQIEYITKVSILCCDVTNVYSAVRRLKKDWE